MGIQNNFKSFNICTCKKNLYTKSVRLGRNKNGFTGIGLILTFSKKGDIISSRSNGAHLVSLGHMDDHLLCGWVDGREGLTTG